MVILNKFYKMFPEIFAKNALTLTRPPWACHRACNLIPRNSAARANITRKTAELEEMEHQHDQQDEGAEHEEQIPLPPTTTTARP
ncbi:hypothetical protein KSP39_PZI020174 [Platanthera zijinensis]|uniref:Uncharacterized protein n=1 Tax=Platanthera zijinensis TaxID=2320716 RepID=A0AAP0B0H5_9ASPA